MKIIILCLSICVLIFVVYLFGLKTEVNNGVPEIRTWDIKKTEVVLKNNIEPEKEIIEQAILDPSKPLKYNCQKNIIEIPKAKIPGIEYIIKDGKEQLSNRECDDFYYTFFKFSKELENKKVLDVGVYYDKEPGIIYSGSLYQMPALYFVTESKNEEEIFEVEDFIHEYIKKNNLDKEFYKIEHVETLENFVRYNCISQHVSRAVRLPQKGIHFIFKDGKEQLSRIRCNMFDYNLVRLVKELENKKVLDVGIYRTPLEEDVNLKLYIVPDTEDKKEISKIIDFIWEYINENTPENTIAEIEVVETLEDFERYFSGTGSDDFIPRLYGK